MHPLCMYYIRQVKLDVGIEVKLLSLYLTAVVECNGKVDSNTNLSIVTD